MNQEQADFKYQDDENLDSPREHVPLLMSSIRRGSDPAVALRNPLNTSTKSPDTYRRSLETITPKTN